jgi:hypothetical protein
MDRVRKMEWSGVRRCHFLCMDPGTHLLLPWQEPRPAAAQGIPGYGVLQGNSGKGRPRPFPLTAEDIRIGILPARAGLPVVAKVIPRGMDIIMAWQSKVLSRGPSSGPPWM